MNGYDGTDGRTDRWMGNEKCLPRAHPFASLLWVQILELLYWIDADLVKLRVKGHLLKEPYCSSSLTFTCWLFTGNELVHDYFSHLIVSEVLCSGFCPLGSAAAWVVAGDRAQLGPIVISGGFVGAAPELQCWVVTSPSECYRDLDLMFPVPPWIGSHECFSPFPRSPHSQWREVLVLGYSAVEPSPWRVLVFEPFIITFSSFGAPSVLPLHTPNKRVVFCSLSCVVSAFGS